MTANRFGGVWTGDKLEVLRHYLSFYTQALKNKSFDLVYIDAFAGTGRCKIKVGDGSEDVIDGSAKIALDCEPAFHSYRFIESKQTHAKELQELIGTHRNGANAKLTTRTAAEVLPFVLRGYDWSKTRGVLFLDPYGLQCDWSLLELIRDTQALDVFFLVSVSGLFRQAAVDSRDIDAGKARRLTAFLGTDEWRDRLYTRVQGALFDDDTVSRDRGWSDIVGFTTERLRQLFPYVGEPRMLEMKNGVPLFALYFVVSNPSAAAIGLAARVSRDILSKLR